MYNLIYIYIYIYVCVCVRIIAPVSTGIYRDVANNGPLHAGLANVAFFCRHGVWNHRGHPWGVMTSIISSEASSCIIQCPK